MSDFLEKFFNLWKEYQQEIPPYKMSESLEIKQKDSMAEKKGFIKKLGIWAPIIGGIWVGSHIAVPLLLLRIPAAQRYLIALGNKLPFHIPGIG